MELFYKYYIEEGNIKTNRLPQTSSLSSFFNNNFSYKIKYIPDLLRYFIKYSEYDDLNNLTLEFVANNENPETFLQKYMNKIFEKNILKKPEHFFEKDIKDQIYSFSTIIKNELENQNFLSFPEIKKKCIQLDSEVKELKYSLLIYEYVIKENESISSDFTSNTDLTKFNIQQRISYLKNILEKDNLKYDENVNKEFNHFFHDFHKINSGELNETIIVSLHDLVSDFTMKVDDMNTSYRRIVIEKEVQIKSYKQKK